MIIPNTAPKAPIRAVKTPINNAKMSKAMNAFIISNYTPVQVEKQQHG